jgi:hypothetical protein
LFAQPHGVPKEPLKENKIAIQKIDSRIGIRYHISAHVKPAGIFGGSRCDKQGCFC